MNRRRSRRRIPHGCLRSSIEIAPEQPEIPARLLRLCFALCVVNLTLGVVAYFSHWWIYDPDGLGIPTISSMSGPPGSWRSTAIRRWPRIGTSRSTFRSRCWAKTLSAILPGTIRRPFCSSRRCSRSFPIRWAFIGWALVSLAALSRGDARDRRPPFGWLLALAVPMVFINTLVGQNGFLTAALIGGTLFLMPIGRCSRASAWAVQLQAAIRTAVSAGADRSLAMDGVRHRRRRGVAMASLPGSPLAPRAGWRFSTGCRCSRRPSSPKATRHGGSCRASFRWYAISAAPNNWAGHSSGC